jgi:hypothetical protein
MRRGHFQALSDPDTPASPPRRASTHHSPGIQTVIRCTDRRQVYRQTTGVQTTIRCTDRQQVYRQTTGVQTDNR